MNRIDSPANPRFKAWSKLLTARGLKKSESFIICGKKLIREALQGSIEAEALLVSDKFEESIDPALASSKLKVFELAANLFDELDLLGTHSPLLVARQPSIRKWCESDALEGLEILCPLGDPQNLGALVRSAEAFAAGPVILLEESAHPFSQKALKASAGALLRHPLREGPSVRSLSSEIYALDAGGTEIESFVWPEKMRLLVGEEGGGLPSQALFQKLSIGMAGALESLNATVAASIALYCASRSRRP